MLSQVPIFKIRINYKSGHSEEMEALKFEGETGPNLKFEWTQPEGTVIRPIYMNMDEVESVWQVGVRDG